MELHTLLQKKYFWVHNMQNLSLKTFLAGANDDFSYRVDCYINYNMEQNRWSYNFDDSVVLKTLGLEHEKEAIQAFLAEETKEKRKQREKIAAAIKTSLSFTNEYAISSTTHDLLGDRKLIFKNSWIEEEEVLLAIYFRGKKKINTVRLSARGEDDKIENFIFSWEFAKRYMEGMEAFEEFLFNKSKDRLFFLFD